MAGAGGEYVLEIAQELRQTLRAQVGRAARRRVLLGLVVLGAGDRMVAVVDLGHQVGDRELQLQGLQARRLVGGHEIELRPQGVEDVGDLGDHPRAGHQERRRERARTVALAVEKRLQGGVAVDARDIDIGGAGVLERQPHELAASLDAGPVVKPVGHGALRAEDARNARPVTASPG